MLVTMIPFFGSASRAAGASAIGFITCCAKAASADITLNAKQRSMIRMAPPLLSSAKERRSLRMVPRRATRGDPASKFLTMTPSRLLREALLAYAEPIGDIARRLANPRSWQGPNGG